MSTTPVLPVLVGPTGAGKTELAIRAAENFDADVEIIGIDSRQLYRQLSVGTAKPTAAERARVSHHLIDCLDINERFDAGRYRRAVEGVLADILSRHVIPLLVGGAGFYLRALSEGFLDLPDEPLKLAVVREALAQQSLEELREQLTELDPPSAARLHPNDRYRIMRALEIVALTGIPMSEHEKQFRPSPVLGARLLCVHLSPDRAELHERIEARAKRWLDGSWQAEIRGLLDEGWEESCPGLQVLGYPEVCAELRAEQDSETTLEKVVIATRGYARQQEIWFRKLTVEARAESPEPLESALMEALERAQHALASS